MGWLDGFFNQGAIRIYDAGTLLPFRPALNIVGATIVDNPATSRTDISFPLLVGATVDPTPDTLTLRGSSAEIKGLTFQGNALDVDPAIPGALSIGIAEATSIEIGDTGVTTAIHGLLKLDDGAAATPSAAWASATTTGLSYTSSLGGGTVFSSGGVLSAAIAKEGTRIIQQASSGGTPTALVVQSAANTSVTGASPMVDFDVSAKLQFADAASPVAAQGMVAINAATIGFETAGTVAECAALTIEAAPGTDGTATLTASYQIWCKGTGSSKFQGRLLGPGGTLSNPAFSNFGDTDTGIWFPAANNVEIVGAGTALATFNATSITLPVLVAATLGMNVSGAALNAANQLRISADLSPPAIGAGPATDYSPTGMASISVFRQDCSANAVVDSIAGGQDGRVLIWINISAFTTTFSQDTGATAANRIYNPGSVATVVSAGGAAFLLYDSTSSRWRVLFSS